MYTQCTLCSLDRLEEPQSPRGLGYSHGTKSEEFNQGRRHFTVLRTLITRKVLIIIKYGFTVLQTEDFNFPFCLLIGHFCIRFYSPGLGRRAPEFFRPFVELFWSTELTVWLSPKVILEDAPEPNCQKIFNNFSIIERMWRMLLLSHRSLAGKIAGEKC